jgi:tetratricopeptide (TPR) repeat protein
MPRMLVTLSFLFHLSAFGQNDDDFSLRRAGMTEYLAGHFTDSEALLRRSLDVAQTANNTYGAALSYSALGDVYQSQYRLSEAESAFRNAISALGDRPEWSHALAITWRNLGSVLTAQGRYNEALSALGKVAKLITQQNITDPELQARLLNTQGTTYFYKGDMKRAVIALKEAVAITWSPTDAFAVDTAEMWNNLGRAYQATRQYSKAEDAFKQSLHLAEQRWGPSHPNLTVVLNNLGSLYMGIRRFKDAEDQFQRSLVILKDSADSSQQNSIMMALYGLGTTYFRETQIARAEEPLAKAAEMVRSAAVPPSEAPEILETYANVLRGLRNPAEAQRVHAEAQRIRVARALTVRIGRVK